MTSPTQDVSEIFSRLFDHRPFLQGEIVSFKKEFEDKRGDREVERLFKALEHTTEIKQVRLDKVVEACDANLPRTIADIQVALRMCEETLKVENKFLNSELLKKNRAERESRLAAAQLEQQNKLQKIDRIYDEKEVELRAQYDKLEKSLLSTQ